MLIKIIIIMITIIVIIIIIIIITITMHFITVVHAKFEIIRASCLFIHGHYFG